MKMALIYLSDYQTWPMGGMLNYVKNIIPEMDRHNVEFDIFGATIDGEYSERKIGEHNVRVYTNVKTKNKKMPNFLVSFLNAIKNRRIFKEYDIIYSHTSATTIALKMCYPKKFVVHHQHGLSYKETKGFVKILNIGYAIAQLLANVTLFVASEQEVEEHKKNFLFRHKDFYSIGSPIKFKWIAEKCKSHSNSNVFLYTGRMDRWKNVGFLVDAFAKYKIMNPLAKLIMIGSGPELETIRMKISEKNYDDYIYALGRKEEDEIINYLSDADLFLFPSKGEGVSLSILEALSAGVPVVGLDVVGVNSLVIPDKTGFLSKTEDIDSYVEKICIAEEKRNSMYESCQSFAKQFDSEAIVDRILHIISNKYEDCYGS